MALISGEDEFKYQCPHCKGYIVMIIQYYMDGGFNHSVEHRCNGKIEELEELEVINK